MPRDRKYGQVELENPRNIGEDEPVFIFRAKDRLLPTILEVYKNMCATAGSPKAHLDAITAAQKDIVDWQFQCGSKIPDSLEVTENGGGEPEVQG